MSSITEQIQADVKEAMKARDSERVTSLRMFVNMLQGEAKDRQRDLTEEEEVAVLQRARKQRIEAAEGFDEGGADDRAATERERAALLERYLPEQLSDAELRDLVRSAITETGAESPKDMGAVMKAVMPKVAGRADGKAISGMVQQELRPGG